MSFMRELVQNAIQTVAKNAEEMANARIAALEGVVAFLCEALGFAKEPLVPKGYVPVRKDSEIYSKISWSLVHTCGVDWERWLVPELKKEGIQLDYQSDPNRLIFSYFPISPSQYNQ